MKLLFFTDTHIKGTNPASRKDSFPEAIKGKFREIAGLIHEEKIDYVLHGGDWFDRPDISPSVAGEFAAILRSFGAPVFTVAGNHDMYGQNPDTVPRTMLGLFESAGLVSLLHPGKKVFLKKNHTILQLSGSPYQYDIDREESRHCYVVEKDPSADYAIHMVHGMLLKEPFMESVDHTLVQEIKNTGADVTLTGHYHSGFGILTVGGKKYANPGSLARISGTASEMSRVPKVVLIELVNGLRVTERKLRSALPSEEVLQRAFQDPYLKHQALEDFYQSIQIAGDFDTGGVDRILYRISRQSGVPQEVREEAVNRISQAQEVLLQGEEER